MFIDFTYQTVSKSFLRRDTVVCSLSVVTECTLTSVFLNSHSPKQTGHSANWKTALCRLSLVYCSKNIATI